MTDTRLITPGWSGPKHIEAFTSTREGGVSQGAYSSFNLATHVGDDPQCVLHNRATLPLASRTVWLEQVHGVQVFHAYGPTVTVPTADAVVTQAPNLVIGVMTADCLPILLSNAAGTEVAAIHGGWRGLHQGVIERTVAQMKSPPATLCAWLGPCISVANFEVGQEVIRAFKDYPAAIKPGHDNGKGFVDMPLIATIKLQALGVSNIAASDLCTYQLEAQFYSHRRATHQGIDQTGRMFTAIAIMQ